MEGEKEALRSEMRRVRSALPSSERERLGALIEDRLLELPEVEAASSVLLFYSFGSEVPTAGMAERILAAGKRLLLPFLDETGRMEAAEHKMGDELRESAYGPKEPSSRKAVDPSEIDVVVTPGLAFDGEGNRLGYGGGRYDRFLDRLPTAVLRIGVAFTAQLVDRVPAGPGDHRVDVVVTDEGAFRTAPVQ